jgi:hypothetical protein
MASFAPQYRKLSGKKRSFIGYTQLWLGAGHLLLVKSTRVTEEYRRFAFSDIHALVVTRLADQSMARAIAAVITLAWMLLALTVTSVFAKAFFGITGLIAVMALIADIARGPRCRCYVYTAVSREQLAPVSRVRQAESFLARLQPEIEAVQGALPAQRLEPRPEPSEPAPRAPAQPEHISNLPEILFGVLLANAVLFLVSMRYPASQIGSVLVTTVFAEIVLALAALLRFRKSDPRRAAYAIVVLALLFIARDALNFANDLVAWFGSIFDAARQGRPTPTDVPFLMTTGQTFAATWRSIAAVVGLAVALFERRMGAPR